MILNLSDNFYSFALLTENFSDLMNGICISDKRCKYHVYLQNKLHTSLDKRSTAGILTTPQEKSNKCLDGYHCPCGYHCTMEPYIPYNAKSMISIHTLVKVRRVYNNMVVVMSTPQQTSRNFMRSAFAATDTQN